MKKVEFDILGMHCVSCQKTIEDSLKKESGINFVSINYNTNECRVEFNENIISLEKIKTHIKSLGYEVKFSDHENHLDEASLLIKSFFLSLIFSLPIMYLAMLKNFVPSFLLNYSDILQLVLASFVIAIGYKFFKVGFLSILKTKKANMDTLIALGVGSAYLYSFLAVIFQRVKIIPLQHLYFEIAAFLITFILLGRFLEAKAKGKTSQAIKKLLEISPKKASVIKNGKEVEILIENVNVGDLIVVKPGEKIAVDGLVVDGYSSVDESMITGESIYKDKQIGSPVVAGTINKVGTFTFKAQKVGKDTVLSQIIELIKKAQTSKAPIQSLADKISAFFVPIVLIIAILAFIIWFLWTDDFLFSLSIFISVLIIACPCALGLATPTVIMISTGMGAEMGILIKNAQSIQKLEKSNCFVFDKTKTLTVGIAKVVNIIPYDIQEDEILSYASSIEKKSSHPLADAIVKKAEDEKIKLMDVLDFEEMPGLGAKGVVNNKKVIIGNINLLEKLSIDTKDKKDDILHVMGEGKTTLILVIDEKIKAIFAIADTLKPDVKNVIEKLNKIAYVLMITGDNLKTAQIIAMKARIEYNNILAEVLPQDKAKEIKKLQEKGYIVTMVGDGINDAAALAAADIGIAIGTGTDIAIESAKIVLIKGDIKDVLKAILLSKITMRKIKQNLFWAFIYNILAIPVAFGALYSFNILLNPMIAGVAMSISSISVVLNSLLMKRSEKKFEKII